MQYTTSFHTPLSTSSSHTSANELLPLYPPTIISTGYCSPVRGPAMQQVAWDSLAGGFFPDMFTLVQRCKVNGMHIKHTLTGYRNGMCIYLSKWHILWSPHHTVQCIRIYKNGTPYPCVHVQHICIIASTASSPSSKCNCSVMVNHGEGVARHWRWFVTSCGLR